jgi:hypothetical protein
MSAQQAHKFLKAMGGMADGVDGAVRHTFMLVPRRCGDLSLARAADRERR